MPSQPAPQQVQARLLEWDAGRVDVGAQESPLKPRRPSDTATAGRMARTPPRPPSGRSVGDLSSTGKALAAALETEGWSNVEDRPPSRPESAASRRVQEVSLLAAQAIERAADAAGPVAAAQLTRHAAEIEQVVGRLSARSTPWPSPSERGPLDQRSYYAASPGRDLWGLDDPPAKADPLSRLQNPEMRYLVTDLETLNQQTFGRAGVVAESSRGSDSSLGGRWTPESETSDARSKVSSTLRLEEDVRKAKELRSRLPNADKFGMVDYTEDEAAEDAAYCQRIRRQLRYTFGPLEPVPEPSLLGSVAQTPPAVTPPEPEPPAEDDWAKQMLADLEERQSRASREGRGSKSSMVF